MAQQDLLSPLDYERAILVQDACNLSGVVHSFSAVITKVRNTLALERNGNYSTDDVNRHPICVMYASKIASLTGCELSLNFNEAYKICREHACDEKEICS